MCEKFLRLYIKYVSPECLVASWFITPTILLILTNSGGIALLGCLLIVAITSYLEIVWGESKRNGKI